MKLSLTQDEFVEKIRDLKFYPKINMMEESKDGDIVGASWEYKYAIGEKQFNLDDMSGEDGDKKGDHQRGTSHDHSDEIPVADRSLANQ